MLYIYSLFFNYLYCSHNKNIKNNNKDENKQINQNIKNNTNNIKNNTNIINESQKKIQVIKISLLLQINQIPLIMYI